MTTTPQPDLAQARALARQGKQRAAIPLFQQHLASTPTDAQAWYDLGYLLKMDGAYDAAVHAFGQALVHGVATPEEAHLNRGVLYADHLRRDEDAQHELLQALAINPGYVPALLNLGNLHEERGQRDHALATYRRLLEPASGQEPLHDQLRTEALARMIRLDPPTIRADPRIDQLSEAARTQTNTVVRANLLFALGHTLDALGDYDAAFDAFAKANRWLVRMAGRRYDPDQAQRLTQALCAAFSEPGNDATPVRRRPDPIFICGMFRSGSTLLEQVLAAHGSIIAGGELDFLPRLAAVRLAPFPASVSGLTVAQVQGFADDYHAHLDTLFPDAGSAVRITDKRPDNYLLIGLIKRMFPGAKIIHTRRDRLDNGLSIYTQHLNPHVAAYACDLADIGHHFGQYEHLMAHWTSLYPDDMFDFDYDLFVREPEQQLQCLLAFLGLEWEPGLLEFHRLRNTVKTASYWQVRQPLHTRASGRANRYGHWLSPLRQALASAGLAQGASTRLA